MANQISLKCVLDLLGNHFIIPSYQRGYRWTPQQVNELLDFLVRKGIKCVNVLILSHADQDHIGGAISLLASGEIDIQNVYLNTDSEKQTSIWEDLLRSLRVQERRNALQWYVQITPSLNGKLNQGQVQVEVLAPSNYIAAKGPGSNDDKGRKLTSNSISAVIRLIQNGEAIALFPGDIDGIGLDNMLGDHDNVSAWLAAFPHHGGVPGNVDTIKFTIDFCNAARPSVVVFSVGHNRRNFPNEVVVQTILSKFEDIKMFTTDSSETFAKCIEGLEASVHKDCCGIIKVDCSSRPFELEHST